MTATQMCSSIEAVIDNHEPLPINFIKKHEREFARDHYGQIQWPESVNVLEGGGRLELADYLVPKRSNLALGMGICIFTSVCVAISLLHMAH